MFNNKKLIYDLYTKNKIVDTRLDTIEQSLDETKIEVQSIDGKVVSNSSAITQLATKIESMDSILATLVSNQ